MPNFVPPPHPDAQALRDWFLYGPKDPAIFELVDRLAHDRQMRLSEIEGIILNALHDELARQIPMQDP